MTPPPPSPRPYDHLRRHAETARTQPEAADRVMRMRRAADLLWEHLAPTGVSWCGFYHHVEGDELLLAARRDKPACSPIGLHGACGRAFRSGRSLVVHDVADLGPNYIACDPRDRSEVVVPLFEEDGRVWGVLDVDSHEVGAFTEADARALAAVMVAMGLSARADVAIDRSDDPEAAPDTAPDAVAP